MKLFIFGATGDLVKRKVLPALRSLKKENLEIYAIGRKELNNKTYSDFACEKCSPEFKEKLNYIQVDYDKNNFCDNFSQCLSKDEINYFYIALPPKMYKQILEGLSALSKKNIKFRILIEKPFGSNLKEAEELFGFIEEKQLKEKIFLSDHYLFKQEIIDLQKENFQKLEIYSLEKIGLEGRIHFYDDIGALKDMIQSHLMNIFFKIIGEIKLENIQISNYSKGQYKDYEKELGKNSDTETFAYLKLKVRNKEITLISGKALNEKSISVNIDGEVIQIKEDKSYEKVFDNFFSEKKENFPKMENAILAWKIIEKVMKLKPKLFYYNQGDNLNQILQKV